MQVTTRSSIACVLLLSAASCAGRIAPASGPASSPASLPLVRFVEPLKDIDVIPIERCDPPLSGVRLSFDAVDDLNVGLVMQARDCRRRIVALELDRDAERSRRLHVEAENSALVNFLKWALPSGFVGIAVGVLVGVFAGMKVNQGVSK